MLIAVVTYIMASINKLNIFKKTEETRERTPEKGGSDGSFSTSDV
jgi:hypothetical protein